MSHICGVSGIKSSVPDADNACVGRQSSSTIEAKRPQSAHTTDLDIPAKGEVVAIVIERVDKTCALICPGFGSSWSSVREAKDAVKKMTPQPDWSETEPGVWLARSDAK
jgi:hypothetical protein